MRGFTAALIGITKTGIHDNTEDGTGYPNNERENTMHDGNQHTMFVMVIRMILGDIPQPFLLLDRETFCLDFLTSSINAMYKIIISTRLKISKKILEEQKILSV